MMYSSKLNELIGFEECMCFQAPFGHTSVKIFSEWSWKQNAFCQQNQSTIYKRLHNLTGNAVGTRLLRVFSIMNVAQPIVYVTQPPYSYIISNQFVHI